MLIGSKSKYYLKLVRSKSKMYEFSALEEDYIKITENVSHLLFPTISILGDAANSILEFKGNKINENNYKKELKFSARFFDNYLSGRFDSDSMFFLLVGSIAYYLCGYIGSSKVLLNKINLQELDLEVNGLDRVIYYLINDSFINQNLTNLQSKYLEFIIKLQENLYNYYETFLSIDLSILKEFKKIVCSVGTDEELFFCDILCGIYFLKIKNSAVTLLPKYTDIDIKEWKQVLNNGFIKEMWNSQIRMGEEGIFKGKSGVIQLPTSSGKTKSISITILSAFLSGRASCSVIVAPFRALCTEISNDLNQDFNFINNIKVNEISDILQMDLFDLDFETKKNVLVLTPEKLIYILRKDATFLSKIGLIIFDESHLFDDTSRGAKYELLLTNIKMYLTEDIQKILISAVIPNTGQVSKWINGDNGVIISDNSINSTEKTLSIVDWETLSDNSQGYIYYINPENPDEVEFFVPRIIKIVIMKNINRERGIKKFPQIDFLKKKVENNDISIYLAIKVAKNGTVCIFCGRKDTVNKILKRFLYINSHGIDISNIIENSNKDEVKKICNLIKLNYGEENIYYKAGLKALFGHHSNISNGIRISIENAIRKGDIRFLACTSTLAQGVNLPIRYLIVSTLYQAGEEIKVRDFHNLIGRTGRSGMHTEGSIIFSEPFIKNKYNYKWNKYKMLIDINNSEDCSSRLLQLVRLKKFKEFKKINNKKKEHIVDIYILIIEYYNNGRNFYDNSDYEHLLQGFTSFIHQISEIINSIESYLIFQLSEDLDYNIVEIIKSTLGYSLASKDESEKLINIVTIIKENILKEVDSKNELKKYSRTLLGLNDINIIKRWIEENSIINIDNQERMFENIYTLIYEIVLDTKLKSKVSQKDFLLIGLLWLRGINYINILEKIDRLDIEVIITICDKKLAYESTLVVTSLSELIEDEGAKLVLNKLSRNLKYGLFDNISISVYELGFSDRIIAQRISEIIKNKSDIELSNIEVINEINAREVELSKLLEDYPSIFRERLIKQKNKNIN